jgi:Zn-dependent protease
LNDITIEILLGRILGLIIGFTLHEFGHAWAANRLGDRTAYYQGRLTLDPRAHIEPVGIIMAIIAGFGWAKPVPVNPRAFYPNEKRGMVIVSLAGPVMNLIIALVFGLLIQLMTLSTLLESKSGLLTSGKWVDYGVGSAGGFTFLYHVLGTIVLFNLIMFLFNLLPFAPLDGFKIAVNTLPYKYSDWLIRYERETTLALMLLLMAGVISQGRLNVLWVVLGPPLRLLYEMFTRFYPVF